LIGQEAANGKGRQAVQYLDFELAIGPGRGLSYPVALLRSPAGEGRGTLSFPFDEAALRDRLKDLQIALLRSGGPQRRRISSPEEAAVQDFGQRLFEALFSGDLRSRYDSSLKAASLRGAGLRVKLHVQAPELAALPWEYLYDGRQGEYLCLSRSTPLVRTLDTLLPVQRFRVQPPLRILGMIASPGNLDPLDIGREQRRMQAALQPLEARGLVRLKWLEGQTWRDLQRAMLGGPWHIFHFSGHGGFDARIDEGMLALANEQGQAHLLRATEVGRLLADHASLRLVVLNACEGARGGKRDIFSSTAAMLARRGIPAVVAMQEEITDQAAIELTRTLYDTLAAGKPVDEALTVARTAISLSIQNTLEWGTPVLYLRSPDGMLFDLPPQQTTTQFPPFIAPQAEPGRAPVQMPPGGQPGVLAPPKPTQRKGRARRVAAGTMGTLRVLGGEGVGLIIGASLTGGESLAAGVAGAVLGGASGFGLAVLEEKARQGASPLASTMMQVTRAIFAATLGLLLGLAFFGKSGVGPATLAGANGALLCGALSIGLGWVEKRARSARRQGPLNFVRTIRAFVKGGIGLLGGVAPGLTIGFIWLASRSPTRSSSSQSTDFGQAIGQAIGEIIGDIVGVLILTVLAMVIGLVVGLIAGAITEFASE
jgi:hypothetical protein